jgi:hypothetical protein
LKNLLILMTVLFLGLSGCAMTGGDDEGGTSSVPRNVDSVTMRNGDVLVGEIALEDQSLHLATDYLKDLQFERRHLESLRILSNGSVKLQTKPGDILHGRLDAQSLRLKTKTGKDMILPLGLIEKVTFAE